MALKIIRGLSALALGLALALSIVAATACTKGSTTRVEPEDLAGTWRAVLGSPGGELPFSLVISQDASVASGLTAVVVNGAEEAPLSSVSVDGTQVTLAFDFYDSAIESQFDPASHQLIGHWRKVVPEGSSVLPFGARRLEPNAAPVRFLAHSEAGSEAGEARSFAGSWSVEFTDESGAEAARGEFSQSGGQVTGTFLTPTGDYRFLEGAAFGNRLRLSTFDGGHAFLFHAEMAEDGSLEGDFWSRDSYHAGWTARPAEPDDSILPDAWSLVGLTNRSGHFGFEFPDLEGRLVSLADSRFENKVVLVDIFGSWCPNCNDNAPLLADWDRRFRRRGLEIVGLAFEFTGDRERDTLQVRRYAERHGIEFPLLLAGVSDKAKAGAALPDLASVIAYPTSVFIGRDGTVRRIHTGYAGPGTGKHHTQLVAEFESLLEELLSEPSA